MDLAQIGRVLGKTQTHVKVLLFRARHKLAAEWETAPRPLVLRTKGANL
jgi:DNA-directed RNA polymerase specialized sigma24 family protein